jgi:polyphosphate kinase 2
VVIVFEGRDAAGKGGTIKRFTEHLNPRGARVVALEKPTAREAGQWYFQRYVSQLPTAGEIVLFDRSWYNRAVVERAMGFCTDEQYKEFMRQTPESERMLSRSGILLIKLWFSVGQAEQRTRFMIRQIDPVRRWKLSPTDLASLDKWGPYIDTEHAPWTVVKSNDKKRARVDALRHVLHTLDDPDQGPHPHRRHRPTHRRAHQDRLRNRQKPRPHIPDPLTAPTPVPRAQRRSRNGCLPGIGIRGPNRSPSRTCRCCSPTRRH